MTTDEVLKIATPIAIILAAVVQQYQSRKRSAEVAEVKATTQEVKATGDKIHTLVNSQRGETLKLNVELSKWKAVHEPTVVNVAAAVLAEKLYADHQAQQAIVNEGNAT